MLILKPSNLRPASKNRVNFDHHYPHKNQAINHHTWNNLNSARTRSIPIPHTKKKSRSIPTLKPSQIQSLTQNSNKFRRHHWDRVSSIPTPKLSKFRCPDPKTKCFSIQTLKPSIVGPPQKHQINSDTDTEIKSSSMAYTETTSFSTINIKTYLNSKKLSISTHHWNQVNFEPYAKFKSTMRPRQKKKVISIQTTKLSHFRTPHRN